MLLKILIDSLIVADETLSPPSDSPLPTLDHTDLPASEYGFAMMKLFFSLIVVAALLGLTLWFLRRLIRYRLEKGSGIQAIKILEKKMISPKTMLYFVEVEGEKILLAESQLEVRQIKTKAMSRVDFEKY